MEFCDRGNIYSYQATRDHGLVDFNECAYIVKSVLAGLSHIHSKNLIHRDIKAENILLITDPTKTEPYGYTVKICDLGFCREDDENVNTFCGTTSYMAPEIFRKEIYDNKVDVWAVGVMLFRMLFGDFPFKSINMDYEISSKCAKGFNIKKMKLKHNPSLSKETFDIISDILIRIFRINPEDRISVEELQKYKFFAPPKATLASISTESESEEESVFETDKITFIESILQKVKTLKFLTHWEEICFEYYIKKFALTLLEPYGQRDPSKGKFKEMQHAVDKLGNYMSKNMKENNISRLS
jgi:serine/threonine protein kinase